MKNPIKIAKRAYSNIIEARDEISQLRAEISNFKEQSFQRIDDLNAELSRQQKINELYFGALYGTEDDKTSSDVKKRFFRNIPKTGGDMGLYQDGNTKLLSKLISLCEENDFSYWLQSGTLLGGVRHGGFVPWDDDTDVAMFRDDIEKLRKLLAKDKKYYLEVVFNYYASSRQIRFRTRNPKNPCFVDVYIYDYASSDSEKAWEKWHADKDVLFKSIENDKSPVAKKWRDEQVVDADSSLGKDIAKLYAKYFTPPQVTSKKAIAWGLDNFPVKWRRLFKYDFIFPLTDLEYEGLKCKVPHEYDAYLKRQYGEIYDFPKDLISHYKHIDHDNIDTDAIREFLNEKD